MSGNTYDIYQGHWTNHMNGVWTLTLDKYWTVILSAALVIWLGLAVGSSWSLVRLYHVHAARSS